MEIKPLICLCLVFKICELELQSVVGLFFNFAGHTKFGSRFAFGHFVSVKDLIKGRALLALSVIVIGCEYKLKTAVLLPLGASCNAARQVHMDASNSRYKVIAPLEPVSNANTSESQVDCIRIACSVDSLWENK